MEALRAAEKRWRSAARYRRATNRGHVPNYLIQTRLPYLSGLPRDVAVNTWSANAATPADINDALVALDDFYGAVAPGATNSVSHWMGDVLDRGFHRAEFRTYLRGAPVGSGPVRVDPFTFGDGVEPPDTMAEQVAAVLSFHADLTGVTIHQGRRRGRVFIGPLATRAVEQSAVETLPRLTGQFRTDLAMAGKQLLLASSSEATWEWDVYSTPDGVGRPIVGGWVDDRPDTQRRRLERSLSRVLWP